MSVVYHGSKIQNLKKIEPRKSTHGNYVYATPDKVLALNFSGRCGDDLTYDIGHFSTGESGPWELIENIPLAFDKMFSNSSSIYTLPDETFKDIHTGFKEVVSEVAVDVIDEEYCENVYQGLLSAQKKGLVKIYRYPNAPKSYDSKEDIIAKWIYYKEKLNKNFTKNEFDRLVYLHPELLDKANELSASFGYNYKYESNDLIDIFKSRVERQLQDLNHEQYVDCAYVSICNIYPDLKKQIDNIYSEYKKNII